MIGLLDLAKEYQVVKAEVDAGFSRVLTSGRVVGGPEVERFERELAAYLGVAHVVGVGSGTDALILSLRALGVGPGDEVITTPFTFVAPLEAIEHVGARVVLVDIDPCSFNLDPVQLAGVYGERTRAILPVHLYGQPAPMGEIRTFAEAHHLLVLEDAAQAVGARYMNTPVGALGDAAAFSAYPTKNLGAYGDAGFVATQSAEVAAEIRRVANHGQEGRYQHVRRRGYTSRLDALQAVVLRAKLPHLDTWNTRRREIAAYYSRALAGKLRVPSEMPRAHHVYHQYTVRTEARDGLAKYLSKKGVASAVHYPLPAHLQPTYADLAQPGSLPQSELAAREVLSIPMYPFLTDDQVETVVKAVLRFFD